MILELHQKLKEKKVSAVELTKDYLNTAQEKNVELNSFISFCEKEALQQAKQADQMIAQGEMNYLTGIPYALKDLFCTKGIQTTSGSKILEGYKPPYNATVYEQLQKAGAVLIGKNNQDEFAMGASGENSGFGPTKNPRDLERVPGGSSSGGAAAVAADQVVFALGTDTGGSIRLPAAFCECVGLKVTYGRVSRFGVIALASSLDTIGPLTKNVEDAAIVLEAIAGNDPLDSTTPKVKVDDYIDELKKSVKGMKVGIPKEYFGEGIEPEIKTQTEEAVAELENLGISTKEVSLPHTKYAVPVYYIILPAEASSNLARYDGIKYGLSERGKELLEGYLKTRAKGFGDEPKRRIMLGTFALSAGYQDAYYKQAQKVRTLIRRDFDHVFEEVDALIAPTSPHRAFKLGEQINDPLAMYLEDIFTSPVNLAGVCGISIPPGMQLIGPQFAESNILKIAKNLEK